MDASTRAVCSSNPVVGNIVIVQNFTVEKTEIKNKRSAVVGAQLVDQSLPTPEVCSSNPVIGKLNIHYIL